MAEQNENEFIFVSQLAIPPTKPMRLRVIHVWNGTLPTKPGQILSFNMLFIDEENNKIQGRSYPSSAQRLQPLLPLGNIVQLRGYSLMDNFRSYRYAPARFCLDLTDSTVITPYDGPDVNIAQSAFRFVNLDASSLKAQTNKDLLDIIGIVVAITYPNTDSLSKKKTIPSKILTIEDLSGSRTDVVLWSPFDVRFNDRVVFEKAKTEAIILAMTGMSVQLFNGDTRLSTTSGTIMLMNEEIHLFDQYKDRFHQTDIMLNDKRIELGTQLKKAVPMTLPSLLSQYDELKQGQIYICTAKVVQIDDRYPWCYLGCKFCTRRVEHHETSYWCKKCGVVDGTLSRYRVNLDVVDGNCSAFFLLFESTARSVFGQPGYKMRENYDPTTVPQSMKSVIVGKVKKFYVVLNSMEMRGEKHTFVVNHLEDADEATSSAQGLSSITTPTKTPEFRNPSDYVTPQKKSSTQFPSQTPGIDTPHQEHDSFISETPTGVKESAISLDDILEDNLQMSHRKVKRPLVFESDDEQDEPHPKK